MWTIVSLTADEHAACEQAAVLLVEGFRTHWPEAWPTMESARAEVAESLQSERILRTVRDDAGNVCGWIGGIPQYDGLVWELHPLVVDPAYQRQGLGRLLVQDFEAQVRARGGLTIVLGSDDESGLTTLADVDLYTDLPGQIARIRNLGGHPYTFYQKQGFVISGVVPDANGRGKPDILMAKRVA